MLSIFLIGNLFLIFILGFFCSCFFFFFFLMPKVSNYGVIRSVNFRVF